MKRFLKALAGAAIHGALVALATGAASGKISITAIVAAAAAGAATTAYDPTEKPR